MPQKANDGREQVSARVDGATIARLDAVAEALTAKLSEAMPGAKAPTRSDATRAAIERGLALLESDLGIGAPKEKKSARKPLKRSK